MKDLTGISLKAGFIFYKLGNVRLFLLLNSLQSMADGGDTWSHNLPLIKNRIHELWLEPHGLKRIALMIAVTHPCFCKKNADFLSI